MGFYDLSQEGCPLVDEVLTPGTGFWEMTVLSNDAMIILLYGKEEHFLQVRSADDLRVIYENKPFDRWGCCTLVY